MSAAEKLPTVVPRQGITVGVMALAWIYDRGPDWARALLERWENEQRLGEGPKRVWREGRKLYTTMPVIHANMPPGKDIALYRRVEEVEVAVEEAHKRIDRLKSEQESLSRRVTGLEKKR